MKTQYKLRLQKQLYIEEIKKYEKDYDGDTTINTYMNIKFI